MVDALFQADGGMISQREFTVVGNSFLFVKGLSDIARDNLK